MREEAGELCQTLEADEGQERAASEAADLFYHALVLLNKQVCTGGGGRKWATLPSSLESMRRLLGCRAAEALQPIGLHGLTHT